MGRRKSLTTILLELTAAEAKKEKEGSPKKPGKSRGNTSVKNPVFKADVGTSGRAAGAAPAGVSEQSGLFGLGFSEQVGSGQVAV